MEKQNKKRCVILDGAMGTMLQAHGLQPGELPEVFGLQHPEVVENIHKAYIDAGSDIIYANTFQANAKKLQKSGYGVEEVIMAAVAQAKRAIGDKAVKVALDIGPIGEMLEPNGYLTFHEAYEIFKEQVIAGVKANADYIVFETMSDLYEVKAAILAAKEHSDLPIFVTMSFEADGRTFTGCKVESFALLAQRLGADAIGINCSLGPNEIYPIAETMAKYTDLPLIIKANAGLPDPIHNTYNINASQFAEQMQRFQTLPIGYIGGCCGSDPTFIKELCVLDWDTEIWNHNQHAYACTPTKCIEIKDVLVIGERINPTGNKRMKEALKNEDYDAVLQIALQQVEAGADILDVNVGLPGIDEKRVMVNIIRALQEIIDVPLQIDSTDPEVIEAALRIYNGIPIVNSINGEKEVMDKILPSIKKYGANVVGLTMDEHGIPASHQKRVMIAKRIKEYAADYGIDTNRIFIDCLTLTVSAQQDGAFETLQALQQIRDTLHMHTVLGVSNISFGLPQRILLNQTFLTMAMHAGLTMPIINPNQQAMMDAVNAYRVLANIDKNCEQYIEHYALVQKGLQPMAANQDMTILESIAKGLKEETRKLCIALLEKESALDIVDHYLIPALDAVGIRYENKEIYLPQLINSATASQMAFEEIRKYMQKSGEKTISKGKILLATVKGDVHDIGKNIVKVVLENYGYDVIDLGKDVPVERVVETAVKEQVYLIGLSALMTTTLPSMKATIDALHECGHDCKIMVGGAVVSREYAKEIHADYYAKDAKESADIAKEVLG